MITIDKEFEIPQYSKICTFCKHNDVEEDHKCEAFPKGIPMEIWMGENDHKEPYEGDHGIQFEKLNDKK